jgi:anti-sigma factor RsiW
MSREVRVVAGHLCSSIDTLAMAYLDDELAATERHELEAHLTECSACRAHLEGERADQASIVRALAAPPAPDLLRRRIALALDEADRAAAREQRRRWTRHMLPGSAILAAVAAIAVFVGVRPSEHVGRVVHDAVRAEPRRLPLEVQGAMTEQWLRQNFEPTIDPPQFVAPGSHLIGSRLLPHGINNHDAALLAYQVNLNGNPFTLSVLIVRNIQADELSDGTETHFGGRTLHVVEDDGRTVVTYVDGNLGYMFLAPELTPNELVWLVGQSDLRGLPR